MRFSAQIAQCVNEHRVIPRIQAFTWTYMAYLILDWFIKAPDITVPQGTFAGIAMTAAAATVKFYNDTGDKKG